MHIATKAIPLAALLAAAGLFAAAPAGAHHEAISCAAFGTGFFSPLTPLTCPTFAACPMGQGPCTFALTVAADASGLISAEGRVDGAVVAECGPALQSCEQRGEFVLAEGASAAVECSTGAATLAGRVDLFCWLDSLHAA